MIFALIGVGVITYVFLLGTIGALCRIVADADRDMNMARSRSRDL